MDAKANDWVGTPGLDYSEPSSEEMHKLLFRVMCGVNAQAFRSLGNRVISGPFSGMTIPSTGPWDDGNSSVKLLGTYEFELHEAFKHAVWRRPKIVVNVGCAEGYYAVGLARLIPEAAVIAFDVKEDCRTVCTKYAGENQVADRVTVYNGCKTPAELSVLKEVPGRRLYVVDVEGAETVLLDPEACPVLKYSDVIVECHDFLDKDASYKVGEMFGSTHRVEVIRPKMPDFNKFSFLSNSPTVMSALMLVEKRPMPCCWLACWATQKGATNG